MTMKLVIVIAFLVVGQIPKCFSKCPQQKISNYDISRFSAQFQENFDRTLYSVPREEVTFRLWTREHNNNFVPLYYGYLADEPAIKRDKPFKFITHGYHSHADVKWNMYLKDEYLKKGDYNIIQVDWRKPASAFYLTSVEHTRDVGKYVGELIIEFHQILGVPYENFHLIGHSLGAHVSGFAGKTVEKNSKKLVARISGMDPAGPGFLLASAKNRLDRTDALFVDVIHTDGSQFGYSNPLGHVDFYPNGGKGFQPGCHTTDAACSHTRASYLFGESIQSKGFLSLECASYKKYKRGECAENHSAIMGDNVDIDARGVFFLQTNGESPFAKNGQIDKI